jgi:predicted nucleic acid-binding protein
LAKAAVADAAPLIAFARAGKLDVLPRVLGEVLVPESVAAECQVHGQPGAEAIAGAFTAGLLHRQSDVEGLQSTFPQLDTGETAAIQLALKLGSSVLIDERLGRAVARRLGLAVIGSLGVLLAGKRLRFVSSVAAVIDQMRSNRYYFSNALVCEALQRAGEQAN